ncbi:MAG: hypothetical protein PHD97_00065 [Bacteroidales bacterium]|nr:hypothetical protein [Bacteroidales bacterium]
MEKSEKKYLIPIDKRKYFPFNYQYLVKPNDSSIDKMSVYKDSKIEKIQNDNAEVIPFYKSISRF